jgi:translocation and assembly module TamB
MTKKSRVILTILASIAALLVVVIVAALMVIQTAWFQNFVREKIISAVEDATGGKVEIGSFSLQLSKMEVLLRNFVIHGTEPSGVDPLLRVDSIDLRIKLLSSLSNPADLKYLAITRPAANIIVFPDGHTNIPKPKTAKKPSNKSGLQTIVDLAVKEFRLSDGVVLFEKQSVPLNVQGKNLHLNLDYDTRVPAYNGTLALDPIYAKSGGNSQITAHLELPVRIEGDAVTLTGGRLYTASSNISVSGTLSRLAAPLVNARANAHISIPEIEAALGIQPPPSSRDLPSSADAEMAFNIDDQTINIQTARLTVGRNVFEASGPLKNPTGQGSLKFDGRFALDQLARLANLSAQPSGAILLSGNAKLSGTSDYLVTGNLEGKDIRVQNGTRRLGPLALAAGFELDPHLTDVTGLRIAVFGGQLLGSAQLREFQHLNFNGTLNGFDLQKVAADLGSPDVGYGGILSGKLSAQADLKAKGTTGDTAKAFLTIAGNRRGTPLSGQISANYSGAADTVALDNSYLALPHSRLDLTGILGTQLEIKLVSHNLNDFLPAMKMASPNTARPLPVTLEGGVAQLNARLTGPMRSPEVSGNVLMTHFAAEQRKFDRLAADIQASSSGAHIANGVLQRPGLQARFDGGIGLRQWSTSPRSPLNVNASIQNADMADIMALAGQPPTEMTGALNAAAQITGTLGNPSGGAHLTIDNGTAYGETFDHANAAVTFADQLVKLDPVQIMKGTARLSASGAYTHPRDAFDSGHLQFAVSTNTIQLSEFKTLQAQHPELSGTVALTANVASDIVKQAASSSSQLAVRSIEANLAAKGLRDKATAYGDLTASAHTAGDTVTYVLDSNLTGSTTAVRGSTRLVTDYPTHLNADIRSLQVEKVLMLAGQSTLPLQGNLTAQANLDGTIKNPTADLSVDLTRAVVYGEPITEFTGNARYAGNEVNLSTLRVATPAGSIRASGDLKHPANDFNHGQLTLHVDSDDIQLARLQTIQKSQPSLRGTLKVGADLAATLNRSNKQMPVDIRKLDVSANAGSLGLNGENLGTIDIGAHAQGKNVALTLDSNLAKSSLKGRGSLQIAPGYPVNGRLYFSDIKYSNLQPFLSTVTSTSARTTFEAGVDGYVNVEGPVMQADQLRAQLSLSQLSVSATKPATPQVVLLQNQGPILVELDHQNVNLRSVHLTGRSTDISATGTVNLAKGPALNLKVNATTDLGLLQSLNRDIYSEGNITVQADIQGTTAQPLANGRIELKNAAVNMTDSPNGISNANGVILLNGASATVRNMTAESGGGKITLNGFGSLTGTTVRYGMRANASRVRTRYSGVSIISSAALTLNGTTDHSLLSGTVTIDRVGLGTQSDTGSLLSSTAAPPQTPGAPSGPLSGMRLDIHVVTSPALNVQTSVTQNLSANADLTVRGSVLNPGVLGRVVITQGNLVFFGNQYTVNRGVVNSTIPLKFSLSWTLICKRP